MGEFINTFEEGMMQDVSIVEMPNNKYLYMKNCSLVSNDGNNFTIKDCLGNTLFVKVNIPYDATYPTLALAPMPIAFFSLPGELIVHSTNDEDGNGGGYGEIGVIRYLPYGQGWKPMPETGQQYSGYTPLYHHASLNFSRKNKIEGYAFPENDSKQNIYWTDNNEEPRVMNVADPVFTTYFTSGSLISGNEYMVLQGAIEHPVLSGTFYGPGLTAGNVFTASATTYTATSGSAPTPRVIAYYPYELMSWTPDWSTGDMIFKEYGVGNVLCGNKVFFHRLYTRDGAYVTPWSYGTFPVNVIDKDAIGLPTGAGTPTATVNSGRSVVITINGIDQRYGYIEVCVAEFDQLIDTPRQVVSFVKEAITDDEMDFEYTGANIGSVPIADITTFAATVKRVKSITTEKNYNIIANIVEREEISIDLSDTVLSSFEYPMIIGENPGFCAVTQDKFQVSVSANPATVGGIRPHTRYQVISGGTALYNGNVYSIGDVFIGVINHANWSVNSGTPVIRPVAALSRYTVGGNPVYKTTLLSEGYFDYSDPAIQNMCTGYWSDEIYGYGLEAIDLKGKPFYVIPFPDDFTFPTLNDKGGIILKETSGGGTDYYSLNPSGLKIDNLFIPDSVLDQMSGFRIVRVPRENPKIVTQGLVSQVVTSGVALYPAGFNPPGFSSNPFSPVDFLMLSPDLLCDVTLRGQAGVVGQTLKEACWLGPSLSAGEPTRFVTAADFAVCRLLEPLAADADSPRETTMFYWDEVDDGQSETVFNNTVTFHNTTIIDAVGPTPSVSCIGGGPYSLANYVSKGGKKHVFGVDTQFKMYGGAVNYGENTGTWQTAADASKILMNVVNNAGGTYPKITDRLYISTGHYQPITAAVRAATAATVSGVSGSLFDGIEVMGGDCFTCYTDYGYSLWNNDFAGTTYSFALYFPCECNANYNLRKGKKVSLDGMYYAGATTGTKLCWLSADLVTNLEGFEYNDGYSSEGQSFKYPGLPLTFVTESHLKNLARFAGPKVIGEIQDSFRVFNTLDFAYLDVQGGPINKIAARNGRVTAWLQNMVVSVPLLERQILSGLPGASTTIGTGGVMDRSDMIGTKNGTQHQFSVIETKDGYVWFDMKNKAFMQLNDGMLDVGQMLGMKSFFSEAFLEAVGDTYSNVANDIEHLINPPDFNETCDEPLLYTGITGVYDPNTDTTFVTFKFKRRTDSIGFTNADFTIALYHAKKQFQYFIDWTPSIAHCHNKLLLSVNNPKCPDQFYGFGMTPVAFSLGQTVPGANNSEYICTTASPAIGYLATPNPAYFTKINTTNEIWLHYQPSTYSQVTAPDYKYNSIFGRVLSQVIKFVINPPTRDPFTVISIEQEGNAVNITDILFECETEGVAKTATDTSIRSTDSNYRTTWDSIISNTPLYQGVARLVGRAHKVTMTKKNWTTDPTVVARSVKILRKVKSIFLERR